MGKECSNFCKKEGLLVMNGRRGEDSGGVIFLL